MAIETRQVITCDETGKRIDPEKGEHVALSVTWRTPDGANIMRSLDFISLEAASKHLKGLEKEAAKLREEAAERAEQQAAAERERAEAEKARAEEERRIEQAAA